MLISPGAQQMQVRTGPSSLRNQPAQNREQTRAADVRSFCVPSAHCRTSGLQEARVGPGHVCTLQSGGLLGTQASVDTSFLSVCPASWRTMAILRLGSCLPCFCGSGGLVESRSVDLVWSLPCPAPHLSPLVDKGLSLLSYRLCGHSVTRAVQKVETTWTSHLTYAPCCGCIPWRRCPRTVYRTQYLVVQVSESRNVAKCCEGCEQLGLHCVLRESVEGGGSSLPCPWAS